MQEILTYLLLALAIGFLGYKFFVPANKKTKGGKNCDHCS